MIFCVTRHHTQAVTSGVLCAVSLAARRTQMAAQSGSLSSVCYSNFCWGFLLLLFFFLLLKLVFNNIANFRIYASNPKAVVSATRISLMASSSSFIFSRPWLWPTIVCLVYNTINDWPELQKHYTSKDTNNFHSDSKTDLKLQYNCMWNSRYSRVPKTFLVDWRLYVACY
jgi:hypothetical protein